MLGRLFWGALAALSLVGLACASQHQAARTPINIAHRGASAYAPEQTLAAFRLAVDQGADYVELDVQITRDGKLVCAHDFTLERTTDVEAVFPDRFRAVKVGDELRRSWLLHDFALEEIEKLDAGSWFSGEFAEARVPTFEEVVGAVGGKAGLFAEMKHPERYQAVGFDMPELFASELRRLGLDDPDSPTPLMIQSFNLESLERIRPLLGRRVPLVLLVNHGNNQLLEEGQLEKLVGRVDGLGPNKSLLTEDSGLVGRAHRLGLAVYPYTFSQSSLGQGFSDVATEMAHVLSESKVDGLITNNPDLFPRR